MQRPDKYPEWAETDQVSDISGEGNAYEPPQSYKDYGYKAYESIGRQWQNWSLRYIGRWIKFLDNTPYTVSSLPANANYGIGKQIYVTDASGGPVPAWNDGTNWRRADSTIVS